jgi:hypothetical protein
MNDNIYQPNIDLTKFQKVLKEYPSSADLAAKSQEPEAIVKLKAFLKKIENKTSNLNFYNCSTEEALKYFELLLELESSLAPDDKGRNRVLFDALQSDAEVFFQYAKLLHEHNALNRDNLELKTNQSNPQCSLIFPDRTRIIINAATFLLKAKVDLDDDTRWYIKEFYFLKEENFDIFNTLSSIGILTKENLDIILKNKSRSNLYYIRTSVRLLVELHQLKIPLNSEIIRALLENTNLADKEIIEERADIIKLFHQANLLQDNKNLPYINKFSSRTIHSLLEGGILTSETLAKLPNNYSDVVALKFVELHKAGVVIDDNIINDFNINERENGLFYLRCLSYLYLSGLIYDEKGNKNYALMDEIEQKIVPCYRKTEWFWILTQAKMVTEARIHEISGYAVGYSRSHNPEFIKIIEALNLQNIASEEMYEYVNNLLYKNYSTIAVCLKLLKSVQIFDQYKEMIKSNSAILDNTLELLLTKLSSSNILTADTARQIIDNINLFYNIALQDAFYRLPDHIPITQQNFNRIITICTQPDLDIGTKQARIVVILQHILNAANAGVAEDFNGAQSTHTESVHKSVSESAKKLSQTYPEIIDPNDTKILEETIGKIQKWINSLPITTNPSDKNAAAQRCIARIADPTYHFVDPESKVSIRQLLGLAWTAIHDDSRRSGTLEDAKKLLIEGFYEIQREYNISEKNVDDNEQADRPACTGGGFNKIMEKLASIHLDVEVRTITKPGFAAKLPRAVIEKSREYLNKFKRENSANDFNNLLKKIKASMEDSLELPQDFWETIKPEVTKEMSGFKVLFGNKFEENVHSGRMADLGPLLEEFEKKESEKEREKQDKKEQKNTEVNTKGEILVADDNDSETTPKTQIDPVKSIVDKIANVIKKAYGNDFEKSSVKHSRVLTAKRLCNIQASSLEELKEILIAEGKAIHFSPDNSSKMWCFDNSKMENIILNALSNPALKQIDLSKSKDNIYKITREGAHCLLDYVDKCERSFKFKIAHRCDPKSPTGQKIEKAGQLAHRLLKCKSQQNLTNFLADINAGITDPAFKNSGLIGILSKIKDDISQLNSGLKINLSK